MARATGMGAHLLGDGSHLYEFGFAMFVQIG